MRTEGGGSYKETARSTRHGCDQQSPLSFHKEGMFLLGSEVEWEPACARKWRVNKLYPGEQGAWGLKVGGSPSFREPALCSDLSLAKSLVIIIIFPGCGKNAENRLYVFCAINYWSDLLIVYISLRKWCNVFVPNRSQRLRQRACQRHTDAQASPVLAYLLSLKRCTEHLVNKNSGTMMLFESPCDPASHLWICAPNDWVSVP